jgi:enoyl-CoA hydratase/carnithine racemase
VEGYAVGAGAGLALLADCVVVAEGATIGFPFFRVGLVPDFALLHTLPKRVGAAKARDLLLFARMVAAAEAVAMGLADHLAPKGGAVARATELARELAAMPPHAFGLAKRQLALAPLPFEAALEAEAMAQSLAFLGEESAEGRAAFRDKRAPKFR